MIALGMALCTVAWWLVGLALGQDVRPIATGAAALVGLVLTLVAVGPLTRRRVRRVERSHSVPPGCVYETTAASAQRRTRLAVAVVVAPVLLLMLDRVTRNGGEMAGFLAGVFAGYAVLALGESGVWSRRERREGHMLYLLVRPNALMPPMGASDVYARPVPEPDEVSPFDIPV